LLSRFYGIDTPINSSEGKKLFTNLANEVMDKNQAGIYNQAAMEFGSLQCKPVKPLCQACPLQPGCDAYRTNRTDILPVKLKSQKVRDRYFNFVVAVKNDCVLMQKRGPKDIWQNLYQFPLFETPAPINAEKLLRCPDFIKVFGPGVVLVSISSPIKHLLSHQRLHAQFIEIAGFTETKYDDKGYFYADYADLSKLAQPKLIFEFLKKFF
jgi:A/G-specific adenine glycosylase